MADTGYTTLVHTCLVDYKKFIKKYVWKSKTFNSYSECISMEFMKTPSSKCELRSIVRFLLEDLNWYEFANPAHSPNAAVQLRFI